MKRHDCKTALAAAAATACLVFAFGLSAGASDITLGGGVLEVPEDTLNGDADTSTDLNVPGQSSGDVGFCLGILYRADCTGSAGSAGSGSTPPSTNPPSTNPPNGGPTGNGGNGGTGGNGGPTVTVDGDADDGAIGAQVDLGSDGAAGAAAPGTDPCAPSTIAAAPASSSTKGALVDVLLGGGLAGSMLAGAMAVKRMRETA
jgi:hypothetical protein